MSAHKSNDQSRATMENKPSMNLNSYPLSSQPLPEGSYTPSEQINGGYNHNQTNLFSGGDRSTHNSFTQQIKNEPMDTTTPGFMTKQEPVKTNNETFQPFVKDEPKPYIKVEPKAPINDTISVEIRGQGNQPKILNISRTASLDDFISQANSVCGFGPKETNTYITFEGQKLSRGTQTIEEVGMRNKCSVSLCLRTYGG